ncbi:MAG: ferritin family protein [bacterium]|nr:ferritin family protein [bacterium]
MTNMNNLEYILDYAIAMEQKAVELYTMIAEKATSRHDKELFLSFAQEERGHKIKLENVKSGKTEIGNLEDIADLKIADYANDVELTDPASYQDILIFAMKQEKQAFRLYSDLAQRAENEDIKDMFRSLAQEEANHKLRFEIEYDENVLKEN